MIDWIWGYALPRDLLTRSLLTTFAATVLMLGASGATAEADVLTATPSTLTSVLAGAQGGDVILLAPGDYGTFAGAAKAAPVTIRPQSGVASMGLDFTSAANIRLEGVTFRNATLRGSTHDVTIAGSRFTGMAVVRSEQMVNANIVFDGNTHVGINVCGNCYEGRLEVAGHGPGPSGVTIKNSVFGPGGNADGVQIAANGVQVLDNEFVGIRVVGPVHSDALQLYGQRDTVVRGNYFHDNDVAIMAPDGGQNEQITDNVFVGRGGYRPAIQLGSHDNTVFAHNTVRNIDVFLDAKTGDAPSRSSVARDNVLVDGSLQVPASKCSGCTVTHNLFSRGGSGANAIVAMPVFAGGSHPGSYEGHVLRGGSPGKGNASDGTDRGIRLSPGRGGPPITPGAGTLPTTPGSANGSGRTVADAKLVGLRRKIRWSRLRRRGVRVKVSVQEPVRIGLRLSRKSTGRTMARKARNVGAGVHTFILRPRAGMRLARRAVLTVRVTNGAGQTSLLRRTIRIRKR